MTSKRVLLVEDNPDDEALTVMALRKSGRVEAVDVVRDGKEALDYLFCEGAYKGRAPEAPALVLLDLKMPKVGGIDVLRRMRKAPLTSAVPVVVLTSSLEAQDLRDAYDLGANSYLRKSVDFGEFTETMRAVGAYWLGLNVLPPHRSEVP